MREIDGLRQAYVGEGPADSEDSVPGAEGQPHDRLAEAIELPDKCLRNQRVLTLVSEGRMQPLTHATEATGCHSQVPPDLLQRSLQRRHH